MPYAAEISRTNPTCFVFLIDQSGSMGDPIGGEGRKKADGLADAINRLLDAIVDKCTKSETVRDYFHVAVIGYGSGVGPALGGNLAGRALLPVSEIAAATRTEKRTKKVEDGAGGLVDQSIDFAVWVDPVVGGATPMCEAMNQAGAIVSDFINRAPNCFPPIVLNISDGEPTDGDPEPIATALRLSSSDGNVLLFNLHLSSTSASPIRYPDNEQCLPDQSAKRLFRMSSVLPPPMQAVARSVVPSVSEASRGFVFNADSVAVVQFLNIGTQVEPTMQR